MSLCSGGDREVLRRRRLSPSCLRDGRVVDRNLRRTAPTVGATGAIDGQLDPITDGGVLHRAHAPDVTLLHVLAQEHLAGLARSVMLATPSSGSRRSWRASHIPRPAAPSGPRWARCPWSWD